MNCAVYCLLLALLAVALPCPAAPLSDPEVDRYNVRIGTQTFAGLYQFTANTLLVETAEAIAGIGSDTIKLYLGQNYPRQYRINLGPNITNLLTLARDEPSCRRVLDMPFRHIIAWAYPFANPDAPFVNGYSATEATNDYREMYDLTCYLLTNYNNSGKTFYLGHWEGDGYFTPWTTNPSPTAITGMINWQNQRQKAVDDAKGAMVSSNVDVFYYAEANRVRDAMLNGPTNNQRVINMVIPYVTNLDYLSYSSYDAMNLGTADLYATLDYMEAHLPTNKVSRIPGERLWIGEYGWGAYSSDAQEPLTRAYIQRLLNYGQRAIPYILFWEIYNNETNRNFWLIDSNGVKVACYYLHQRFLNTARLSAAQFKERNGRLPTESEFVSLVSPALSQPLAAPVNLTVTNLAASLVSTSAASVSGILAQGVYGDDQAIVRVFYGRQDGGTTPANWEQFLTAGLNTNFNPATFTVLLTNLAPQTNYYFRFYATNASGEAWAPVSGQFSSEGLDPQLYGASLTIRCTGYDRGETLLNFPVLVELGPDVPAFSYWQFASPTGGDLRFTDANGRTLIRHEIDQWNTNGTSTIWVRVPKISSTNDSIRAYWGNPLSTNPPAWTTNGTVWSFDHQVVYHLKETGFPYADSARQHPALAGVAPASTAGEIGRGCRFNGLSQYLDAGVIDLGDAFTLSAWVNINPAATNIQTLWANQQGGYGSAGFAWFVNTYLTADQKVDFASGDGVNGSEVTTAAGAVSFGQWHLLSASVDRTGGTVALFVDGNHAQSGSPVAGFANNSDVNLGRFTNSVFYFNGTMDEARIQNGTVSSNWAWASWMTVVSNHAFASYSGVTRLPPVLTLAAQAGVWALTWPGSGVGYALYTATNLAPPIVWSPVSNAPDWSNSQWQITLPVDDSAIRFYRLQAQ